MCSVKGFFGGEVAAGVAGVLFWGGFWVCRHVDLWICMRCFEGNGMGDYQNS